MVVISLSLVLKVHDYCVWFLSLTNIDDWLSDVFRTTYLDITFAENVALVDKMKMYDSQRANDKKRVRERIKTDTHSHSHKTKAKY